MAKPLIELRDVPVTELKKLQTKSAAAKVPGLASELGIETVLDLLLHYPRRYIDRTKQVAMQDLTVGEEATVLGTVRKVDTRRTRQRRAMVVVELSDGAGYLRCTFFNQPWRAKQLSAGTETVVFGRVESFQGRKQMTNPVVDVVGGSRTGRVIPIYPQSEKARINTYDLDEWVAEALRRVTDFDDPVPTSVLDRLELTSRDWAMRHIHQPDSMDEVGAARKRLVFDELLRIQLVLVRRKRTYERTSTGIQHEVGGELVRRFHEQLPFPLTAAQRRAIAEIEADLAKPVPMHRLLQGDVGSGKTIVAVSAMLAAVQGGHQGALMAPTEVLAEQHGFGIRRMLEGFTVPSGGGSLFADRALTVALLTNRTAAKERARILEGLGSGEVDIVIGTHALIEDKVAFRSLGVAVIDEQHRFGVEQRAALRSKGELVPDVLVMTATPIPRTAAMTVYGDLDVSVLDELPPGRTPVATVWAKGPLEVAEAWQRVRDEVAAGRQAYVVTPLIEESEKLEVASAEETFAALSAGELQGLRLGLLHGKVKSAEKESVMDAFRAGALDVLVATTVIEVGVDVPNATVMVIVDADRFGIAQLHQLRGRVGRGADESWCYLLGEGATSDAERRLLAIAGSTDGFALAEEDLEIRGEGTLMATRQKGRSDLKLASLRRDKAVVATAREIAFELVDGGLEQHPRLVAEIDVLLPEEEAETEYLFKS
ncbi:MAG TPA: ATP-dependent DNA helicase RecG [Acidimicrobiales bacterium]|nr:ATP-dependent DNA helicase RecG [Acidimicrobiales bacterium]